MWKVIFIVNIVVGNAAHLYTPLNGAVVSGDRFTMKCSTKAKYEILWYRYSVGKTRQPIYTGDAISTDLSDRFFIDSVEEGHWDLKMINISLADAGRYECHALSKNNGVYAIIAAADLTVFASEPLCETNATSNDVPLIEGSFLQFLCRIGYSGNTTPVMQWNFPFNTTFARLEHSNYESTNVITSTVITQVEYTYNGMMNIAIEYLIMYPMQNSSLKASNPGSYKYQWNVTLNVKYGPKNLIIKLLRLNSSADGLHLRPGDQLLCSADADPVPWYLWKENGAGEAISSSLLIIDEKKIRSELYEFQCTAFNNVADVELSVSGRVSFYVHGNSANWITFGLLIGAVFAGIILTASPFVVQKLLRKKPDKKRETEVGKKSSDVTPTPSSTYDSLEDIQLQSENVDTVLEIITYENNSYIPLTGTLHDDHPSGYNSLEARIEQDNSGYANINRGEHLNINTATDS